MSGREQGTASMTAAMSELHFSKRFPCVSIAFCSSFSLCGRSNADNKEPSGFTSKYYNKNFETTKLEKRMISKPSRSPRYLLIASADSACK